MHPRWLVTRRSTTDPTEQAYHLCYRPALPQRRELIRVAGARWAVEEGVQTGGVLSLEACRGGWRYRS